MTEEFRFNNTDYRTQKSVSFPEYLVPVVENPSTRPECLFRGSEIIQPPSWKQREHGINFFPSNIIILKFETEDQKDERWNFCIDTRFKNIEELVQRYKNLVDDPGFDGHGYFPREEDQEFYDEYSKFIGNG